MEAVALPLEPPPPYEIRHFSSDGCVVVRGATSSVFIGGIMIHEFDERDPRSRPTQHRGGHAGEVRRVSSWAAVAAAFDIGDEYLRRLRRKEEAEGVRGLLLAKQGTKESKSTPEQRAMWHAMFAAHRTPTEVYRAQPRPKKSWLSLPTVWRAYGKWQHKRDAQPTTDAAVTSTPPPDEEQLTLFADHAASASATDDDPDHAPPPDEGGDDIVPMTAQPVRGGAMVQHAGCWIVVRVTTKGSSGCTSVERTDVEATNDGVDVLPFDRTRVGPEPCPADLVGFEHEAAVTFDVAGEKTIRVHGRRVLGKVDEVIQIPLVVVVE